MWESRRLPPFRRKLSGCRGGYHSSGLFSRGGIVLSLLRSALDTGSTDSLFAVRCEDCQELSATSTTSAEGFPPILKFENRLHLDPSTRLTSRPSPGGLRIGRFTLSNTVPWFFPGPCSDSDDLLSFVILEVSWPFDDALAYRRFVLFQALLLT